MKTLNLYRFLVTAVLLVSTFASFYLDWRENHLLNPLWHPHARFHGGLLLFTLAGISAIGIWAIWRRSTEPEFGVRVAAWLAIAYWTPLFYVNVLVPGSSLWAGVPGHEPRVGGYIVYPNLVVAALFLVIPVVALVASQTRGESRGESQ